MCGIAGIVFNNKLEELQNIDGMTSAMESRGPDDSGVWVDHENGVALGHRRLSIIDLSELGHQPMVSPSGRFVMTYNGEIYNCLDIRKELVALGASFKGHSDTEIMLAAFDAWGVSNSLKKFNGMFAFAVWDKKDNKLYLGRDRFGEKPLYYGWVNMCLIFASELKALKKFRNWRPKISRESLCLFLRYGYVPNNCSIYEGISKLKPGEVIEISGYGQETSSLYWNAFNEARLASERQISGLNEEEIINELEDLLLASVQRRCISDVPLGVFLSGGIDSTLVAALTQKLNKNPIKTFTIGFHEKHFNNEAPYAKETAKYLGTDHTELYVTEKDAEDVIPKLPSLYDEPFADSSQIPTYLVSSLAKKNVKVCLSGDGGDELFGGYSRYIWFNKIYGKMSWVPKCAVGLLGLVKDSQWDFLNRNIISRLLPSSFRVASLGQKICKVLNALKNSNNKRDFYVSIISTVNDPEKFFLNSERANVEIPESNTGWSGNNDFIHWMMLADTLNYLPGDILTKVDRASMGVSLEARTPYLDEDLFRFIWRLPLKYKVSGGEGKYILRKLLYRHVPKDMMERPKAGFGVPIGRWIKGDLRDWAEDLLDESKLRAEGYFQPELIRSLWEQHLSEKYDHTYLLWNFLMFQSWLRNE